MEKTLKRLASFATFDLPFNIGYNRLLLCTTHKEQIAIIPSWNIEGTQRMLIAHYWYRDVLYHFSSLFGIALLIILPFTPYFNLLYLSVLCLIGAVSFGISYFCIYLPFFSSAFLPQLESLIANHKKVQVEVPQTKSAKTQSKIPALTTILYVLFKMAGANRIACDAFSAQMFNRITGVDTDSIKENIHRILYPETLTLRERAERAKGMAVARTYFEKLGYTLAIKLLDELENPKKKK
jgi:hypothetical protein